MKQISVYIFPEESGELLPNFAGQAKKILTDMKVLSGEDHGEAGSGLWAGGENSKTPFEGDASKASGFEHCAIYDKPEHELIPDVPGVEPACPGCDAKLGEEYYETISDLEESGEIVDYSTVTIKCAGCSKDHKLTDLKDDIGIFVRRQFINFEEAGGKLSPQWLEEFAGQLGTKLKSVTYYYS